MKVDLVPIDSIVGYARNPRRNEKAIPKVKSSLKEYGFRQPIVVDADGVIVVGHTRWMAAKELGMTEVPVHVAENLHRHDPPLSTHQGDPVRPLLHRNRCHGHHGCFSWGERGGGPLVSVSPNPTRR